jgi:hypothetical protein
MKGKGGGMTLTTCHVGLVSEDGIKISATYVLFYKRIQNDCLDAEIETDSNCPRCVVANFEPRVQKIV